MPIITTLILRSLVQIDLLHDLREDVHASVCRQVALLPVHATEVIDDFSAVRCPEFVHLKFHEVLYIDQALDLIDQRLEHGAQDFFLPGDVFFSFDVTLLFADVVFHDDVVFRCAQCEDLVVLRDLLKFRYELIE